MSTFGCGGSGVVDGAGEVVLVSLRAGTRGGGMLVADDADTGIEEGEVEAAVRLTRLQVS